MCFKTATLKVGYPVKGPSDGKNHTFGLNMGSSITENMFGSKQYSRDKFHIKEESGTCNECASTCSCCMAASLLRMKADVGFSYETSKGKVDVQYCRSGADMLSPVDSSCNSRNLSTSEISHLLSACSSHDSFSENEESKDTLRESGTFEHSEMQVAVNDQQTAQQNPGLSRTTLFHDSNILFKKIRSQKNWNALVMMPLVLVVQSTQTRLLVIIIAIQTGRIYRLVQPQLTVFLQLRMLLMFDLLSVL
ncbi:hypothetical protein OIU79_010604 [Salix purpurea]|uniref:Uncharacterized protein n=1 Tax=Salix purpurea TaxID=77065 RepID=A0A9Q0T9U1_SALPP|nr:hypothetical protein OIU79_010604 [Salix purpurea]